MLEGESVVVSYNMFIEQSSVSVVAGELNCNVGVVVDVMVNGFNETGDYAIGICVNVYVR